jgi:hypothetical protein
MKMAINWSTREAGSRFFFKNIIDIILVNFSETKS